MSGEVPYKAHEYGDGNSDEIVALVAGFNGPVDNLEKAATDLVQSGRDAIVYTYHPRILLAGHGHLLPEFIDTLHEDFITRTSEYSRRRYGGVSLGGAIAVGMQKKDTDPEHGLYAATGINAAELIMKQCVFRALILATHRIDVQRAFERNGHTLESLSNQWQYVNVPPVTPFTVVLGGMDYVIQKRKIARELKIWHETNNNITVIHKPLLGHNGTIKWFNNNVMKLIEPDPAHPAFK